jgi:hypothetical protein
VTSRIWAGGSRRIRLCPCISNRPRGAAARARGVGWVGWGRFRDPTGTGNGHKRPMSPETQCPVKRLSSTGHRR